MKFTKIFSIAFAAVALAACSDSEEFNTADVSVDMKDSVVRISEDQASSTSYSYIPVVVTGETNGPVKVTIALSPVGDNGAVDGVNYVMTSTTITIPAGETTGRFQYYPKGDDIENPDRAFEAKIVKVEGGKIGQNNITTVTLVDNEGLIPTYYAAIQGEYTSVFASDYGGDVTSTVTVSGDEKGQPGYGKTVKLLNWPEEDLNAEATFSVDGVNEKVYLIIAMDQSLGKFNFKSGPGDVVTAIYPAPTSVLFTGAITYAFNLDCAKGELMPVEDGQFGLVIKFESGSLGIYDRYSAGGSLTRL